jgi:hypothetical protein
MANYVYVLRVVIQYFLLVLSPDASWSVQRVAARAERRTKCDVPAVVAAPREVPVLTPAWLCADEASAGEPMAVGTVLWWPDHPLAAVAED